MLISWFFLKFYQICSKINNERDLLKVYDNWTGWSELWQTDCMICKIVVHSLKQNTSLIKCIPGINLWKSLIWTDFDCCAPDNWHNIWWYWSLFKLTESTGERYEQLMTHQLFLSNKGSFTPKNRGLSVFLFSHLSRELLPKPGSYSQNLNFFLPLPQSYSTSSEYHFGQGNILKLLLM